MANDMKPKAPGRGGPGGGGGPKRPGMNPLFAGIIIGLLLGIFLALGVAIWLNRTSNPFVEKTKPVESLPAAKSTPPPAASAKTDPANPEKPRFEFYQILPGEKDPLNKKAPDTPAGKESPKEPAKEATKEAPKEPAKDTGKDTPPPKSLNEILYLQAGAFQSETEAENLKAKIAFAGFEATVKPVNVAGKGTLFRVRLGPYKSQDEVNRIKGVLSQNGIGASVVKPD
jgi:cell division protein FtsN